ncbi:MAG: PQQ-binding-like beta-propeller repeat protein [Bacteroidales bacterium]|nr:PQQ-binding-like beta-propeller repeat protein [Bacteroidales bacterium]
MKRNALIIILITIVLLPIRAQLYDWRGPSRTGVYNETGLLKEWPENGPELIWENEDIGFGYSSVTISDDAIYITGRKLEEDIITAFTLDGVKKWSLAYGDAWMNNFDGSRGTATYYNGKLYLVSGSGAITCVSEDGKIVWSKNHFDLYGSSPLRFGISESPVYVDGKIITSPGGSKASLVAFNAENGDVIWEAEALGKAPQYINPQLIEHGGKKIIVTVLDPYIIGVDTENGNILFSENYDLHHRAPGGRISKNHAVTPLYRDGKLLIANGYDYVGLQFQISEDASSLELLWKSPDLEPHHGGMVLLGDYIYSSDHMSNSMGAWLCVNWTTGETAWKERWITKGPIISADDMLYLYEEKSGNVALANINTEKLDIVSTFQITKGDGPYWAHPVIRDGRLYVRHGANLMVYDIRKK